jgi:hypothetical protein
VAWISYWFNKQNVIGTAHSQSPPLLAKSSNFQKTELPTVNERNRMEIYISYSECVRVTFSDRVSSLISHQTQLRHYLRSVGPDVFYPPHTSTKGGSLSLSWLFDMLKSFEGLAVSTHDCPQKPCGDSDTLDLIPLEPIESVGKSPSGGENGFATLLGTRSESSITNRLQVLDHWFLDLLEHSFTHQVLVSHYFGHTSPQSPQILPWLLNNLAYWREEILDLTVPNQESGMDSRGDLLYLVPGAASYQGNAAQEDISRGLKLYATVNHSIKTQADVITEGHGGATDAIFVCQWPHCERKFGSPVALKTHIFAKDHEQIFERRWPLFFS